MSLGKIEIGFLLGLVMLFCLIIRFYRGKNIPKWVGIVLLLIFIIYIYTLSFTGQSI